MQSIQPNTVEVTFLIGDVTISTCVAWTNYKDSVANAAKIVNFWIGTTDTLVQANDIIVTNLYGEEVE